eukprot:3750158-Amphidinium_carterae.1
MTLCTIVGIVSVYFLWACQHCGKYGQRRWGGLSHTCLLAATTAGRNALARLWAGYHPASRPLGAVWRLAPLTPFGLRLSSSTMTSSGWVLPPCVPRTSSECGLALFSSSVTLVASCGNKD